MVRRVTESDRCGHEYAAYDCLDCEGPGETIITFGGVSTVVPVGTTELGNPPEPLLIRIAWGIQRFVINPLSGG